MSRLALIVLTHLDAATVARQLAYLRRVVPEGRAVVAYGGTREEFARLDHERSVFIEDPSLRGPIREQSYNEVLAATYERFVAPDPGIEWVHLIEWDHVPLRDDYAQRLLGAAEAARADLAGKNLVERSGTNWPHALAAAQDAPLQALLDRVSVRDGAHHAIFGGLGNGWLIRRAALEAFLAVDHVPGYVELYLPTLVHHLGFRVADFTQLGTDFDHVRWSPPFSLEEARALRARGATAVHPVKDAAVWDALG